MASSSTLLFVAVTSVLCVHCMVVEARRTADMSLASISVPTAMPFSADQDSSSTSSMHPEERSGRSLKQFQTPFAGNGAGVPAPPFPSAAAQTFVVDPNTGQLIPNTGRHVATQFPPFTATGAFASSPASAIQFDPITGQYFVIDPSTGRRIFIRPNSPPVSFNGGPVRSAATANEFFATDPVTRQQIQVNPTTGQPLLQDAFLGDDGFLETDSSDDYDYDDDYDYNDDGDYEIDDPPFPDQPFGFPNGVGFPSLPPFSNGGVPFQAPPSFPGTPSISLREGAPIQFDPQNGKPFVLDPLTGQPLYIGFESGEVSIQIDLEEGFTFIINPFTQSTIPLQVRVDSDVLEIVGDVLERADL